MDSNTIFIPPSLMPASLRRDPARKVNKLLVGVKFRDGAYATPLAGIRWSPDKVNDKGIQEAIIYEDDYVRLEAHVHNAGDDETRLVQAQESHLLRLREYLATTEEAGTPLDAISEDPQAWTKRQKRFAKLFPGSVEEELFKITKDRRGPKPFASVEVLENLGIPKSDQEELLTRFAQATGGGAQSEATTQMLGMIAQLVDKQSQMLERMDKRMAALEKRTA